MIESLKLPGIGIQKVEYLTSRWRFQMVLCSPLPGEMIQVDIWFFKMGWFNHQLAYHMKPLFCSTFAASPVCSRPSNGIMKWRQVFIDRFVIEACPVWKVRRLMAEIPSNHRLDVWNPINNGMILTISTTNLNWWSPDFSHQQYVRIVM